jgi:uncharacterized membrane protein YgcG
MQHLNLKIKNYIYVGVFTLVTLFHSCENKSNVKLDKRQNLIIDNAELFSMNDRDVLENYLYNYKRNYNVVVLVEGKCDFDKEVYLKKIVNEFGGRFHSDKIVLFYFLVDEKSISIKTSKLLGLSDDICADILNNIMLEFKKNNFSNGVIKGLELIDLNLKYDSTNTK